MLTLTASEWRDVRRKLRADYAYKPSVMMIREVMKRELGFTTRYHKVYKEQTGYIEFIYLDFFDDAKETWFRLKYL